MKTNVGLFLLFCWVFILGVALIDKHLISLSPLVTIVSLIGFGTVASIGMWRK